MKTIKNIIAVIILILFVAFMCKEFFVYSNKKEIISLMKSSEVFAKSGIATSSVLMSSEKKATTSIVKKVDELIFFNIKKDDKYYDTEINSLEILKNALGNRYQITELTEDKKNALINMFDIVVRHNTRRWKDASKDKEYLELLKGKLKGVRFLGDSQISVMAAYNSKLEINDTFHTFKGKNIKEQIEVIDENTVKNCDTLIMFNGGNLMHFNDEKDYIDTYDMLIDKEKSYNKNLNIYITSLCPVSKAALEEDLKSIAPHNFHLAPTLDTALKNEYLDSDKATYIDTKWIVKNYLYNQDGKHFKPEFYMSYIPYVLYFIEYTK